MNSSFAFAKSRRFAPLFATQFLGAFNDNLFKTTLFVLISFHGLGKSGWLPASQLLNVAALLFVLPYFLFSALSGQLSSRFNKARLAQVVKVMEIAIMLLAAYGFYINSAPLLLLCLFLMGTHSTLFGPVKYAILPEYLQKDELIMGNGLIESGTFLAILFGQIIGTAIAGSHVAVLILMVVLLAAAGLVSSLFMPSVPPSEPQTRLDFNIVRGTKALLRQTFAQNELATAILGISWFWFVGAVYTTQLPTFVQKVLGGGSGVFNLMLTLFSIGIALGSVLCAKLSRGGLYLGMVALGALGLTVCGGGLIYITHGLNGTGGENLSLFAFLTHGHAYAVVALMVGIGFFGGFFSVPLYTWLQTASSNEFRAHAIAANNIVNGLFMVAAAIFSAVLLLISDSTELLYLIVAAGNLPMLVYLARRVPDLVRFKRRSAEH